MRTTILIAVLLSTCAPAHAGGLVGTGPEVSLRPIERPCERPVYGRDGTVLYWTGQACSIVVIDGDERISTPIPQPHPVDPVVPVDPPVEDPDTSNGKTGNASANNGKGGNYDKTGHTDNGKGQGKGRN